MFIKKIAVENVKSFREREETTFNRDFNLLIGPNGGGKSNLIDIVTISLNQFIAPTHSEGESGTRPIVQTASQANLETGSLEKHIGNENSDSRVELTFELSQQDIDDLKNVLNNVKQIEDATDEYYRCPALRTSSFSSINIDYINRNREITFEIVNNRLQDQPDEELNKLQKYIEKINLILILAQHTEQLDISPLYFHFSAHRGGAGAENNINVAEENYYDLLSEYISSTSGDQTSAVRLALYKLAQKYLRYVDDQYGDFQDDEEVETIIDYFRDIGYGWSLRWKERENNVFEMILDENGTEYEMSQLSSGENEIANLLLGLLSINIEDGAVLIDEPGLHLHPTWQRIAMEIFEKLGKLEGIQFIFTTHSATFINKRTVSYVTRVSQIQNTSRTHSIDRKNIDQLDSKFHIINSINNEKMFFADEVALVEGPTDRLIFQALVEKLIEQNDRVLNAEVLDVGGKHNFDKYPEFLEMLNVPYHIIGDRDYAYELSKTENIEKITRLFSTNYGKIDERMKTNKSGDVKDLAKKLDKAIESNDQKSLIDLKNAWNHIKSTKRSFKPELDDEEEQNWEEYVNKKSREGTYVLSRGDIEEYLPYSGKSLDKAINLTSQEEFEKWFNGQNGYDKPEDLIGIAEQIIE